jgi:hypothetical protein
MGRSFTFRLARRTAVAWAMVCACSLVGFLMAPRAAHAATVLYDFSSPPNTTLFNGSFTYDTPGGPSVTFEGLQYDDSGSFADHTNGTVGAVFGTGPGPAVISFSSPVDLVEFYVNNFSGDFDSRPDESKLFSITASLGGSIVFTYDRAAQSTAPDGVSDNYLLIAPGQPVSIDSISLSNFDQDVLDDLKVNVVPEPGGALVTLAGMLAVAGRRTGRGEGKNRRGGHAPERDPPREDVGGQYTLDTQANGVDCAAPEKKVWRRKSTENAVGTCT